MIYTLNPSSADFSKNLTANFQETDNRFHQVDIRFEKTEHKIDVLRKDMDAGFEKVNTRLDSLESSMNHRFNIFGWVMGLGFGLLSAVVGTLCVLVAKAIA